MLGPRHLFRPPGVKVAYQGRVAQAQVFVGDLLGAAHQRKIELHRVHVPEAADVLEKTEADTGRMLDSRRLLAPRRLVGAQRHLDVAGVGHHRLMQGDGILERELGARTDGKMRRVRGITEQHHVLTMPRSALDGGEIAPERAVGQHLVLLAVGAAQFRGEYFFNIGGGGFFVIYSEARILERRIGGLHHQRAFALGELVGMQVPDAVLVFLEAVGEAGQVHVGAQPDKFVGSQVDVGLEVLLQRFAHRAADAIGGDDQVGAPVCRQPLVLGLVGDIDAQCCGTPLQDLQQGEAFYPGKTMARGLVHRALVVRIDVIPIRKIDGDIVIRGLVGKAQVIERFVRQDDAKTEGVVGTVALDHVHLGLGHALFGQDGGVQAGRPSTNDVNSHRFTPRWGAKCHGTRRTFYTAGHARPGTTAAEAGAH